MKNTIIPMLIAILTALVACSLSTACQSPIGGEDVIGDGGGLITVTIGGTDAKAAVSWANTLDSGSLVHTITVSGGQGGPHTATIPAGGGTANFSVTPGEWTISVVGALAGSGELAAVGSETREINEGNNGTVTITMQKPADWPGFTVSFDSGGGSAVASQTVNKYSKAARPTPPPSKAGFVFDGWYGEPGLTTLYNFSAPVTAGITLYANWAQAFTVTFMSNDGSGNQTEFKTVQAKQGDKISAPSPAPTLAGRFFEGWYKDINLTNQWVFSTDTVTADITLYARWDTPAQTPVIDTQPDGTSIATGQTATLEVKASVSDGGKLSYQWYSHTTDNNTDDGVEIVGAVSDSYTTPTLTLAGGTAGGDYYYYFCVVTNTKGSGKNNTASTTSTVATVEVY
jgi:uncharacterized repeat protein (TIGR02543 family)